MSRSESCDTFCDADSFALIRDQVADKFEIVESVYCFSSTLEVSIPESLKVSRYLDRFYVISDPARPGSDIAPESVLFDAIASEYNADVNRSNNIATADALLRMTGATRVIDLGCGTGLALQAPAASRCSLVGIDASDQMLTIARDAGMNVVNLRDAGSLSSRRFDGLIACYALHLHGPRLALLEIRRLLEIGGRVAANFHKGVGYPEVSDSLTRNGFELLYELHAVPGIASPVAMWERVQ